MRLASKFAKCANMTLKVCFLFKNTVHYGHIEVEFDTDFESVKKGWKKF